MRVVHQITLASIIIPTCCFGTTKNICKITVLALEVLIFVRYVNRKIADKIFLHRRCGIPKTLIIKTIFNRIFRRIKNILVSPQQNRKKLDFSNRFSFSIEEEVLTSMELGLYPCEQDLLLFSHKRLLEGIENLQSFLQTDHLNRILLQKRIYDFFNSRGEQINKWTALWDSETFKEMTERALIWEKKEGEDLALYDLFPLLDTFLHLDEQQVQERNEVEDIRIVGELHELWFRIRNSSVFNKMKKIVELIFFEKEESSILNYDGDKDGWLFLYRDSKGITPLRAKLLGYLKCISNVRCFFELHSLLRDEEKIDWKIDAFNWEAIDNIVDLQDFLNDKLWLLHYSSLLLLDRAGDLPLDQITPYKIEGNRHEKLIFSSLLPEYLQDLKENPYLESISCSNPELLTIPQKLTLLKWHHEKALGKFNRKIKSAASIV